MLVEGQVHGGIVQGIGQALLEGAVYDDSGQLLTGSFMDYTMPRADNMPSFDFSTVEVPCKNNAMGVKGCGEAGSVGAPAAVINALVDALARHGVRSCRHAGDAGEGVAAGAAPAGGLSRTNGASGRGTGRQRCRCRDVAIVSLLFDLSLVPTWPPLAGAAFSRSPRGGHRPALRG